MEDTINSGSLNEWSTRFKEYKKLIGMEHWLNYKEMGSVEDVQDIMNQVVQDKPERVSIDTETTGLDFIKDKVFQFIFGYYYFDAEGEKKFKGWSLIYRNVINTYLEEDRKGRLEEAKKGELEEAKKGELEEAKKGELEEAKKGELEEAKKGELEEDKKVELEEDKKVELEADRKCGHIHIDKTKLQYSAQEVVNTKAFLDFIMGQNLMQVYHNAKYDIGMIQTIYPEFKPTNIMDTIMLAKHVDKDIEEKPSMALKSLADSYYIRSTLPELETIKTAYKAARTIEERANVIENAVKEKLFPISRNLLLELDKMRQGQETEYFKLLLNKPEVLVKKHRESQTEEIIAKFEAMFPEWEMSLKDTYKYMTDAYSTDELFYECRKVMLKFNQEVLGFKNEWSPIFKTGTQYNFPDYLKILVDDPAVLLIYGNMDVKLTLDLFNHLYNMMKKETFDADQMKVLRRDIAAIYPILEQEKTGLYVDTEYVLESIDKAKVHLREINDTTLGRLTHIAGGDEWKKVLDIKDKDDLKANNYTKYVKFFETYAEWFKLPIHEGTDLVKIDTVSKLVNLYKVLNGEDEELKTLILKNNARQTNFAEIIGGDGVENPLIRSVALLMLKEGKRIIEERDAEVIQLTAEGKPPRNKYRKKEKEILEVLQNFKTLGLIGVLEGLKDNLGTIANKFIKEQELTMYPVKRTINKKNMNEILSIRLNEYKEQQALLGKHLTDAEMSTLTEIINIVKDKATEASLLKWIGVYMIKILGQVSISVDDRIRTSFLIAGPVTGRLSGDIQQFPKKPLINKRTDEVIYHPRKAFKVMPLDDATEPVVYAFLDFSQIELRVAAEYTMRYNVADEAFIRAYVPYNCYSKELGMFDIEKHKVDKMWKSYDWYTDETYTELWEPTDMHAVPVNKAFPELANIDISEESTDDPALIKLKTERRGAAKGICFGRVYGSSLNGILENPMLADFDKEVLTDIYNMWSESYPSLVSWMKFIGKNVANNGGIKNLSGRLYRQGFRLETNKWGKKQYSDSYKAVNYIVQGEAAQVLKVAMIRLHRYMQQNNLKSKLITNIHDECGFMVPVSEIPHIVEFQRIMQEMEWINIDLVSDMEIAVTDWSEKIGVKDTDHMLRIVEENKDILNKQLEK